MLTHSQEPMVCQFFHSVVFNTNLANEGLVSQISAGLLDLAILVRRKSESRFVNLCLRLLQIGFQMVSDSNFILCSLERTQKTNLRPSKNQTLHIQAILVKMKFPAIFTWKSTFEVLDLSVWHLLGEKAQLGVVLSLNFHLQQAQFTMPSFLNRQ